MNLAMRGLISVFQAAGSKDVTVLQLNRSCFICHVPGWHIIEANCHVNI